MFVGHGGAGKTTLAAALSMAMHNCAEQGAEMFAHEKYKQVLEWDRAAFLEWIVSLVLRSKREHKIEAWQLASDLLWQRTTGDEIALKSDELQWLQEWSSCDDFEDGAAWLNHDTAVPKHSKSMFPMITQIIKRAHRVLNSYRQPPSNNADTAVVKLIVDVGECGDDEVFFIYFYGYYLIYC